MVTYTGKNVPVGEVASVLLKVSGQAETTLDVAAKFQEYHLPTTISVEWKETPFWEAARQFEALTGLSWVTYSDRGLFLQANNMSRVGEANGRLVANTPLVKIALTGVTHSAFTQNRLDGSKPQLSSDDDKTSLLMSGYLDPKLQVEFGLVPALELHAGTESPSTEDFQNDFTDSEYSPRSNFSFEAPLPQGFQSGDVVPSVSGKLKFAVVTASQKWKVSDLVNAKDVQQMVNGTQYTVSGVKTEGIWMMDGHLVGEGLLRVTVSSIEDRTKSDNEQTRFTSRGHISTHLKVFAANGRELVRNDTFTSNASANVGQRKTESVITFLTGSPEGQKLQPEPYRLEWDLPTAISVLETPFEVKNVKVP